MPDNETSPSKSRYRQPIYLYILCAIVLLYAISFGPLLCFTIHFKLDRINWLETPLVIGLHPHFWLMGKSKYYYSYSIWWAEALGNPKVSVTFEEYKKHYGY